LGTDFWQNKFFRKEGIVKSKTKTRDKVLRGFLKQIISIEAREAKIIDPKTVKTALWVR